MAGDENDNEVRIAELAAKQAAIEKAADKADQVLDDKIEGLAKKLWAVILAMIGVFIKLIADYIGARGP